MRKLLRFLLGLAACGALVFGTVNLAGYLRESRQSVRLNEELIEDAVEVRPFQPEDDPAEGVPIQVDFEVLAETNGDIIGWLYSEDTPINLPVVQSSDNERYLRRLVDGSWNSSGALFADYRNAGDFSDPNTVIYGHNMKNGKMFGTLPNYKRQAYYDEHPQMWLLTPDRNYKVELVAGYVTPTTSDVYSFDQSEEAVLAAVRQAIEKSTFTADAETAQGDRFLTLSTCSYEYDNARYVLIGRLIALR